jgi:hypothetical protein
MALKDNRYTITGSSIQVAPDLILDNPEIRVNTVYYKAQKLEADIELLIREGQTSFLHSRSYTISVPLEQEGLDANSVDFVVLSIFPNAVRTDQ